MIYYIKLLYYISFLFAGKGKQLLKTIIINNFPEVIYSLH